MNERPRRPILHLKLGTPTPSLEPKPAPTPLPIVPRPFARPAFARKKPIAPPPAPAWKCRPCGAAFDPPRNLMDDEHVRCPSCNARLGLARDFRSDPPAVDRLRARPAKR